MQNEGMPIYKAPLERGVLIVQFLVGARAPSSWDCYSCPHWGGRKQLLTPTSPLQVIFPEKHWLPQDRLPQLEALLPPRQKVRVTDDMDQAELMEFSPGDHNWRQHREAYEEDDDGPRGGVQCQMA